MTQLASAAGLSQQMISYVERGMRSPTLDTLLRLPQALHVDLWKVLKMASNGNEDDRSIRTIRV